MNISFLEIENFRCYKKIGIEFDARLNVLIGLNGAGKTAILDSIAISLIPMISRFLKKNGNRIFFKDTDVRNGEFFSKIYSGIDYHFWSINKTINVKKQNNVLGELDSLSSKILSDLENNSSANVPILAYYSTTRILFEENLKYGFDKSKPEFLQFNAFKNCFNTSVNSFNDFIQWFEEEEGYEDKVRLDNDNNYRNPKLQAIRKSIELFLNGFESMQADFKNIRIKKERNNNHLKYQSPIVSNLVINKNGIDFQISQLSSGEKMMLMLIVDIARRLSIANPSLDNPLLGEGIILIDEIDLHLHPQWQRDIVPAITQTFPNCQFIMTTHSPQVLSKVKKESVRLIEDNAIIYNIPNTYGRDSNSILGDIFNTLERPKHIKMKIDECFKNIDEESFEIAKKQLDELIAILGEDDLDLIRAKSLLIMYEP